MAHHKAYLFDIEERTIAAYCKALAHPARARILRCIKENRIVPFEQITREVPLAVATIQEHLLRLQLVQLIEVMGDGSGKVIGYKLNELVYEEMQFAFETLLSEGGVNS
ncbi:MAG: helix-turn-helix domain-containing protein [Bacteroidota bacterium]